MRRALPLPADENLSAGCFALLRPEKEELVIEQQASLVRQGRESLEAAWKEVRCDRSQRADAGQLVDLYPSPGRRQGTGVEPSGASLAAGLQDAAMLVRHRVP